ncbi:MAG TPA: 2-phospho-L-lactate guanylyltransferase [Chloroflexia bacterium]|nr:2-phospho-L-lactate guanylyltransferase [Chloroflexia bacterium]
MKTAAIVPVKGLGLAKSRLGGIFTAEERALLVLDMLAHVLGVLRDSGAVDEVAVVSPSPEELPLPEGVHALKQRRSGLNAALEQGRRWAVSRDADAVLVAFADLPALTARDISRIAKLGRAKGTVVLAPDRHGTGTNLMLAHPAQMARFAFGPGSFAAHNRLAEEAGAHVRVYRAYGTGLDIDTLDDLEFLDSHRVAEAMEYAFSA